MDIYDLNQVTRTDVNSFYDLTDLSHRYDTTIQLFPHTVLEHEEMRIDLICSSIYGNITDTDVLLYCNFIDNPLNIKAGSTIYYPAAANISLIRYKEQPTNTQVAQVINPSKSTRTDPSRDQYVNDNYSLPPVLLDKPIEQVTIKGNNLVIGNGLF